MLYNCKVIVDDTIMYDKTLKSMKLIAEDLGVPYSRIADCNTRPIIKKSKFKYEPRIIVKRVKTIEDGEEEI